MRAFFGGHPITLYSSGTAALAQALARCAARSSVTAPEVILPAYGCPNLVSACIHASVRPRLVDVARSIWSYDSEKLTQAVTNRTIAIISVNLLGVDAGTPELLSFTRQRGLALIQDSAQFLPRDRIAWPGDYIILSFGRGKPLNLLFGGALIDTVDATPIHPDFATPAIRERLLSTKVAALAFNLATRPHLYWFMSRIPGLGINRAIYKELRNSSPLGGDPWYRIDTAFSAYRSEQSYRRQLWEDAQREWEAFGIRPLRGPSPDSSAEPLRLALLAPNEVNRDEIVSRLSRANLGASQFYANTLPNITHIPEIVRHQGPFPNAELLAQTLFTLPTHTLVTDEIVQKTSIQIRRWRISTCRK